MEAGKIEELNDSGTMTARYTIENGSYYGQWLHLYRPSVSLSRFPMYDNIGTVRGLLDASGAATDWYELDTFGRQVSSSGTTPNPYRYGGAWGDIADPSGMQQLGQRFYWPELGRFVSQDPPRVELNWYAYARGNPVRGIDPQGTATPAPGWMSPRAKCEWDAGQVLQDELERCDRKLNRALCFCGMGGGIVGIGVKAIGGLRALAGALACMWNQTLAYGDCVDDATRKYKEKMKECQKLSDEW